MKKIITLFATTTLLMITGIVTAQEKVKTEVIRINQKPEDISVSIENDDLIIVNNQNDTTRIRIGNKHIEIIDDGEGGTNINVKELKKEEAKKESTKKDQFKGNWSGLELGLNNFMNRDFTTSLDPASSFMDLNTNRSYNVNLNLIQYDIGFKSDKVGLVTGVGFEFNNYFFDRDNSIQKDINGNIVEYIPDFLSTPGASMIKTKLAARYLNVPLLVEFQIPAGKKRVHISGGVTGGLKIGSNTKIVYKERGDRQKDKVRDDFNLSSLRYGISFRAGYSKLNVFANYYPVSLFESNKGPELYPFSAGLRLISF